MHKFARVGLTGRRQIAARIGEVPIATSLMRRRRHQDDARCAGWTSAAVDMARL